MIVADLAKEFAPSKVQWGAGENSLDVGDGIVLTSSASMIRCHRNFQQL